MNIETIKIDKWAAKEAAREYMRSVRKHRAARLAQAATAEARARLQRTAIEREDEALRRAYSAIARGVKVINLTAVMRAAGLTEKTFLPRLACMRADKERAWLSVNSADWSFYSSGYRDKLLTFRLPLAKLNDWEWRKANGLPATHSVEALCPQIPPRHRPEDPTQFYLLWEANWQLRPPDPDPFLLKHIEGPFFAIVAQWDMTPLEQSILEGRVR